MRKLFGRFASMYVTDRTGSPSITQPYLTGQLLPMSGDAQVILPLAMQTAASIFPASGPVGTEFTITPATYTGTGPITRVGELRQNGAVVINYQGSGSFTFVSTATGPLQWVAQASGLHASNPPQEIASATITAVAAPAVVTRGYVLDGDSITQGYGVTPTYPDMLASQTGLPISNLGVSGRMLSEMDTTFGSRNVAGLYNANARNTLIVVGGINDIMNGNGGAGASLTDVQNSMMSYLSKARTAGFKVLVGTLTGVVGLSAGRETIRQNFNTWIRNNAASLADGLVDFAAVTELSVPGNTIYFADGLHPTRRGFYQMAVAARTASGVTLVSDTIPDSFNFPTAAGVQPSTLTVSPEVEIMGINAPAPISVSGGSYSINGGSYTTANGTVLPYDLVRLRGTSSAANDTSTTVSLNIGGSIGTYTITTEAATSGTTNLIPNSTFNVDLSDWTFYSYTTNYSANNTTPASGVRTSNGRLRLTAGTNAIYPQAQTTPINVTPGNTIQFTVNQTAFTQFGYGVRVTTTGGNGAITAANPIHSETDITQTGPRSFNVLVPDGVTTLYLTVQAGAETAGSYNEFDDISAFDLGVVAVYPTMTAGMLRPGDIRVAFTGSDEFLQITPSWHNGAYAPPQGTTGEPSFITWNADRSATLNARFVGDQWHSGKTQVIKPQRGMGLWEWVVSSNDPNAVLAMFTYDSSQVGGVNTATNGNELDFEYIVLPSAQYGYPAGTRGFLLSVHFRTSGSARRSMAAGFVPYTAAQWATPTRFGITHDADRTRWFIDGVQVHELTRTAFLAAHPDAIWSTTSRFDAFSSVERHTAWAGWTTYTTASMVLWGVRVPTAAEQVATPVTDTVTGALWVGHVTSDSITVSASMVQGTNDVRFAAVPTAGGTAILSAPTTVNTTYRNAKATISGLTPGVSYNVELRSAGGAVASGTGRARTLPATLAARSFSFGAASCSQNSSNALIFDRIRERAEAGTIEFFQHMGDIHYRNISTDSPEIFNEALDQVFQQSRQAAVWRSLPTYYIYDDHDYSNNNGHRLTASRPAAVATFRARVPSPTLPNAGTGTAQAVYYGYTRGRFRFLVTDMRADRDSQGTAEGPAKTMLGAQQKQWLKDEIIAAKAANQFIVWVNPVPWNTTSLPGDDSWGGYTTERQELVDFFTEQDVRNRMTIVSGDMHALAWDDGTNSPGGIPVMQAAALDRDSSQKGGPYTIGPLNGGVGWGTFVSQYGVFDVTDTGGQTASIRFRGMNVNQTTGAETALIDVTRNLTLAETVVTPPVEPGAPETFFTNFSAQSPGPLAAPWIHLSTHPSRFSFGTALGQTVLEQNDTTATGDTGAILTALEGNAFEFYSEGQTSNNNSSSLEWLIAAANLSATAGMYRIDVNPATDTLRLRRRQDGGHGTQQTAVLPQNIQVNETVSIRARCDAGRVRVRVWITGTTEPTVWHIDWTDPAPYLGPYRAGAYTVTERYRPIYLKFGVGINGAAAPTAPELPANQFFTNFSTQSPGPLAAPWVHLETASDAALHTFGTAAGQTVLQQAVETSGANTGAILTAIQGDTIEAYIEGQTNRNDSSSLEWALFSAGVDAQQGLYRVDINPATSVLRMRRRSGGAHGSVASATLAQTFAVNQTISFRVLRTSTGRIRVRCWVTGTTEPAVWHLDYTDASPFAGPYRIGAFNIASRFRPIYLKFGVGIDGAVAPTAPLGGSTSTTTLAAGEQQSIEGGGSVTSIA